MFYKYFCSSHIPEEEKQNKTKHLQPKLVVPCGGPSRLRPWGGPGVSRASPTEHSVEDRLTSHFPGSWCLWLRKIESVPVLPNPRPWLLRPAWKAASGHSGASPACLHTRVFVELETVLSLAHQQDSKGFEE